MNGTPPVQDRLRHRAAYLRGENQLSDAALMNDGANTITQLQARVDELERCLQEIITEKELHGQVVDGTMKARKLLAKGESNEE